MRNRIKNSLFGVTINLMAFSVEDETKVYLTNPKRWL